MVGTDFETSDGRTDCSLRLAHVDFAFERAFLKNSFG